MINEVHQNLINSAASALFAAADDRSTNAKQTLQIVNEDLLKNSIMVCGVGESGEGQDVHFGAKVTLFSKDGKLTNPYLSDKAHLAASEIAESINAVAPLATRCALIVSYASEDDIAPSINTFCQNIAKDAHVSIDHIVYINAMRDDINIDDVLSYPMAGLQQRITLLAALKSTM